MSDQPTALGLRMPRGRTARHAVRLVLIVLVLLVFMMPLWSLVSTALDATQHQLGQVSLLPARPTLANLTQAWHYGAGRGLVNSLIVVAAGVTLQLSVSTLAAYALARKRFLGAGMVMLVVLATLMMPEEVIAIPTYLVLGKIPVPFTGGTLINSYGGLILPLVGWALPIYLLTGFMKTIPAELEEAARIDGAGDLAVLVRVILPLSRPALGTCAVFGFLMVWDQYLLPLLVAQSPNLYTLTLVVTNLQSSDELGQGVKFAAALILLVPSTLVYLFLQRFFTKGLLAGSLKG
ncbi:MAG TPA: carbohydrate ABC transporter permease [Streptosporangiaceae bacterium]|nr:carbohydrate ABC transporter permease [Streptosporangiaceae bacterium]